MSNRATTHDIIVIGGSAGALGPLIQIVAALPEDIPASVFVVIHTPANSPGLLPMIIGRSCALNVQHAGDGGTIQSGSVYVAPPDRHLLLMKDGMQVVSGPRENRSRPAIDALFRTAARAFGPRVTGVLLSGVLNDGTYGLMAVKQHGGVAIVQDPEHADYPDMPASAIEDVEVDHVLPPIEIANLLKEIVVQPVTSEVQSMPHEDSGPEKADQQTNPRTNTLEHPPAGELAPFVCPDCGGALWEIRNGRLYRYRCHVGHSYTAEALLAGQTDELEAALWAALRALEENVELARRLATRAGEAGHSRVAQQHQEHSNEMEQRAEMVQRLLRTGT